MYYTSGRLGDREENQPDLSIPVGHRGAGIGSALLPQLTRRAEHSEATRQALVSAARRLFATRGYADTSIELIVQRARVTRGALYHHFDDKRQLFRAVYEESARELADAIESAAEAQPRPELYLEVGCNAFLDACMDPGVQRIALLDGPSVLGWKDWHEIEAEATLGMLTEALQLAMDAGYLEQQPVEPLAALVFGALGEAGMFIARAEDVDGAREAMGKTVARLIEGLKPHP
jgi:AcrR family transcriptional regulator